MSVIASPPPLAENSPKRLDVLFEELSELAGQRNVIDARIVQIAAEMEREELCGATGARSVAQLVAWKLAASPGNARAITAVAGRLEEFPRCVAGLREGRLSLDQLGVIAAGAPRGSDEHFAALAAVATVQQLRTAIKLEPRPDPGPRPAPRPVIVKHGDEQSSTWRITLPHVEAAMFDAALQAHLDALVTEWRHDHDTSEPRGGNAPPFPGTADAFVRLVEAGWDAEAARSPHGQHHSVVMHVDVDQRAGVLHLGPVLSEAERQYLSCDATYEVWFERDGEVIGAGRSTRHINRRLRRVLEHRDRSCRVPGCDATRGLHAHHIVHWDHGGPTDLINLVLLCPYHHRAHHRGLITITGTAATLTVTDSDGQLMHPGSLAHPPTQPPPDVPPWPGPLGERADWKWYDPFQPLPPPTN